MQAIILAAGMGKRLGAMTRDNTKCMIEVGGVRLIDRLLGQLRGLGLKRVVIVIGYKGRELREYIGDRYPDLHIEYVDNPVYDRTNNIYSLSLAARQMEQDDTLLLESDLILDDRILPMVLAAPEANLAVVDRYRSWMDGTVVKINEDRDIINLIPKKAFSFSEVDQYYKTVNVYKFSQAFAKNTYLPFLEAYIKTVGLNEYYEQVLRIITALERKDFKALPLNGQKWYEIDDIQDLDNAELLFTGDTAERLARYQHRYGGYWRYPELLDFCYLVNPYFPPQRMKEEIKASFDSLLTQYPSGMGVNSLLAGKYFSIRQDHVVVGNGAAELIKALMEAQEGTVGIIAPTFEEYPNRLRKENRIIAHTLQTKGFRYSAKEIQDFFQDREVGAIVLVNPDNPSGNFLPQEEVMNLIAWCKERGIRLVIDESFVDFSNRSFTLLDDVLLEENPHLAVVKSISKSYGVPGLRLGILASGDRDLIARLKKDVAIWNINSFAEFYLQIFNKYEFAYREACQRIRAERDRFFGLLQTIPGLEVYPSDANYFLCKVLRGTSRELAVKLLEKDILIKDASGKRGLEEGQFIRIAVRDTADNDRLITALKELL